MPQLKRLSEPTFAVLLSLAAGPNHGYGIMKEVEELTDGRIRLSAGTLYGALKRMLELGWVVRKGVRETNGRERKIYAISSSGAAVLRHETESLHQLVSTARRRLATLNSRWS